MFADARTTLEVPGVTVGGNSSQNQKDTDTVTKLDEFVVPSRKAKSQTVSGNLEKGADALAPAKIPSRGTKSTPLGASLSRKEGVIDQAKPIRAILLRKIVAQILGRVPALVLGFEVLCNPEGHVKPIERKDQSDIKREKEETRPGSIATAVVAVAVATNRDSSFTDGLFGSLREPTTCVRDVSRLSNSSSFDNSESAAENQVVNKLIPEFKGLTRESDIFATRKQRQSSSSSFSNSDQASKSSMSKSSKGSRSSSPRVSQDSSDFEAFDTGNLDNKKFDGSTYAGGGTRGGSGGNLKNG